MSDFFSRLAERALGTAPLAQPVIAPAFSPDPGVAGAVVESAEWVEPALPGQVQASGLSEPWETPIQPSSLTISEQPVTTTPREAPTIPPAQAPQSMPPPETSMPEPRPRRTSPRHRQEAQGRLPLPQEAKPPTDAPTIETPELSVEARAEQQVILVPVSGERERPSYRAISSLMAAPQITASPEPQPDAEHPTRSPILQPAITPARRRRGSPTSQDQPHVEAQVKAQVTTPASSLASTPATPANEVEAPVEPSIRVTIGRVEVRLVQPPAPAKALPARNVSSPALSLDDYLKQRREGRR
jgi:hypothetical protein